MKFKLPIENYKKLQDHIISDLELIDTKNPNTKPVYEYLFQPKTNHGKIIGKKWVSYYTDDIKILKKTQKTILKCNPIINMEMYNDMVESWNKFKSNKEFRKTYQFIEWDFLSILNESPFFLLILSFFNISAPITQILGIIFSMIVPFFLLKMKGEVISLSLYMSQLINIIKKSSFGNLFNSETPMLTKIYSIMSIGILAANTINNFRTAYCFRDNLIYIHDFFEKIEKYYKYIISQIKIFDNYLFYENYIDRLSKTISKINNIKKLQFSREKSFDLGNVMHLLYSLYNDNNHNEDMEYSFEFIGFCDCINGVKKNKKINRVKYRKKTNFVNMYYPGYNKPIKNNIDITKNIIITGPNASGKTSVLKSTYINLLFSQQIGFGFFDVGEINPYNHFHLYLNIPDTCDRDSLFQSEARRCLEIYNSISLKKGRHFCIFDELFSGTNPDEAISCAFGFLKTIQNMPITFILTTHFYKLCESLSKEKNIKYLNMSVEEINDNLKYNYKMINGINKIKGGKYVLKQLGYPDKIIQISNTIS